MRLSRFIVIPSVAAFCAVMGCFSAAQKMSSHRAPSGSSAKGGDESGGASIGTAISGGAGVPGLTAGMWDDNANFDFYLQYLGDAATPDFLNIPSADRIVLSVKDSTGAPVSGAKVTVTPAGGTAFTSTTGSEGKVLYFPQWSGVAALQELAVVAEMDGQTAEVTAHQGDTTAELTLGQVSARAPTQLDLVFLVDTTGSMGDEIGFLQREFRNIVRTVEARFPEIDQRWGLVLYRDEADAYIVRYFDFTTDEDEFQRNLTDVTAQGGGDWPEALDRGLARANKLSWREGNTARVMFHVADAPCHESKAAEMIEALQETRAMGVHVYPIAASGVNAEAEVVFRMEAEVTGGRYLFLTDDSGLGESHAEPHIPCFQVALLQKAMGRMIAIELTGEIVPLDEEDVLRTAGSPMDGSCKTASGQTTVQIF